MPNTLAHLGLQTPALRLALRGAELEWIFLGAVLPDLPWILQRVLRVLVPEGALYDLRLYAIVQSSLAFCCLLGLALAFVAARPVRAFGLLAASSLLHLLFDAAQTKYGNGVHLLAPLDWRLEGGGWFWPEHPVSLAASALGVGAFAWAWRVPPHWPLRLPRSAGHAAAALALVLAYLLLPLALLDGPEAADNHSVRTLRERGERSGKAVAFDRVSCGRGRAGPAVRTPFGEEIPLHLSECPARTVSLRGRFVGDGSVRVEALHAHWPVYRDAASYLGLLFVALVWGRAAREAQRG